jgi:hypothetical protein
MRFDVLQRKRIEMSSPTHMQTEPDIEANQSEGHPEWWKLTATIGIDLGSVLVYPLLICGCHFHASAVVPTIVPTAWSIYLLTSYRTRTGQVGSWVAFGIAMLWLWAGIDSNLKFMFR